MLHKNRLFLNFSFFIYPIGALPFLIYEIYHENKTAILLFSILAGMFAFLSIPLDTDDLTRYYFFYNSAKDFSFNEIKVYILTQTDFIFSLLIYCFSAVGISKQFIPFLSVFIGYYLYLKIFQYYARNNIYKNTVKILLFIIVLFSIDFRGLLLGIRNGTAIAVFIYGVHQIIDKKSKIGWVFLILSGLTHSMILFAILIVLVAPSKRINFIRWAFIFSIALPFLNSPTNVSAILNYIAPYLGSNLSKIIDSYTSGYWALDFLGDQSIKGRIAQLIGWLPYFSATLYLIYFKTESRSRNILYILGIFTNFIFPFPVMFGRYAGLFTMLFIFLILNETTISVSKSKLKFLYQFSVIAIILFSSMLFALRQTIIKSYPKMLYQTSISVFFNRVSENDYIIK